MTINDAQLAIALISSALPSDADRDNPAGTSYFGYARKDGSWRIMQQIVTGNVTSYRYVEGTTNYAAAWTARVGQPYAYPA